MTASIQSIKPIPVLAITLLCIALSTIGMLDGLGINYSDFYREAIAEVGSIGLFGYWLYCNRKVQHTIITLSATRIFLLGLLLFASMSVFWAVSIAFFISKYLLWLATAVVVFLVWTLPTNSKVLMNIARGFAVIAAYIALVGLIQAIFSIDIFIQNTSPSANFVNKNVAMQVIVLIFPLLLFLLLFDSHQYLSKFYYFIIAFVLAYAFYTQSRSAWVALALEFSVVVIGLFYSRGALRKAIREKQINWSNGHALTALFAVLTLLLLLTVSSGLRAGGVIDLIASNMASIQHDFTSYSSPLTHGKAPRYQIWGAALQMIGENPMLGTGMGSFYHNLLRGTENYTTFTALRAHNDVLETGVELGIVGLIFLFGAIIGLLLCLYPLIVQGTVQQRIFYLLVAAALAGSAVNMQFSFPYQMPVPLIILGVYIGLIIKGSDAYNTKRKTILVSLKSWHWHIALTSVGLLLGFVVFINFMWMTTMSTIHNNTKRIIWENPIHTPLCHKSTVHTLFYITDKYFDASSYRNSLRIAESIEQCIPDTWLAKQKMIQNLNVLHKYEASLKIIAQAKQQAPIGIYADHINQIIIYNKMNNLQGATQIYEELSNEAPDLLVKKRKTLRTLVIMALHLERLEDARKFYRVYTQYYPYDAKFDGRISARLQ